MAKNYVCNGAKIECQLCTKPEGTLKVTSNEIKIQDKLFATEGDKEKINLIFEGNCKKSWFQASPCISVMKLEKWQGVADLIVQDQKALLEDSTIMCTYGGVPIKITDHLQVNEPTELQPLTAPVIDPISEPTIIAFDWKNNKEGKYKNKTVDFPDKVIEKTVINEKIWIEAQTMGMLPGEELTFEITEEKDHKTILFTTSGTIDTQGKAIIQLKSEDNKGESYKLKAKVIYNESITSETKIEIKAKEDLSLIFNPKSNIIDKNVDEYKDAIDLNLSKIPLTNSWTFDGMVDAYAELYGDEKLAQLLYIFTSEGQGAGLGYQVAKSDFWIDNYSVNHDDKMIYIDSDETFSNFSNEEAAHSINNAIADIAKNISYENETFWGSVWRITKGTGITVLGGVEVVVGAIGVITPEPATSVGGVLLVGYGTSTVGEGISMMLGANEGEGYNLIEEGFAKIGGVIDAESGDAYARGAFLLTNIVVSLGGSYKILKVPKRTFIYKGTHTKLFTKYYDVGYTVGRLQLNYPFEEIDKVTKVVTKCRVLINVTNNSNQWILRFQTIGKTLVMNGRIVNVSQLAHRISSKREMIKVLIKLAGNGFKKGI